MTIKTHTFTFEGSDLRCFTIGGHTQFAAVDVFQWLKNIKRGTTLRSLNALDKGAATVQALGGPQQVATVTEAGLYKLIMRAEKANPKVLEFQNWIAHNVLPAIRQDSSCVHSE